MKKVLFALILLGLVAAGYFYYIRYVEEAKAPEFSTTTVSKGALTQTVTATGDLAPVLNVNVSSQISGNILKLYVDWNSPVKQGQVLAELDPSSYKTALLQSEGQLANAKANYQLMLANARRSRELFAKNLIAQSDLDTVEAQLAQADAQVQIQNANNETAKVNLSRCTIYSPIDGTVISRQVDVGNTVAASLSAPTLFIIANDLRNMQIDAAVSEADIGNIEVGQAVNFTVDAYPNRQFRGTVSQIRNSPKTSQNVVIYDTMIDVRNDDLKLRPGMTANASIVVASRPNAFRIANSALRVRLPDGVTALPVADAVKPGATPVEGATRPATDEERRKLMADAGFVRGNGPPSPEVIARIAQLAKERGLELPAFGGRGGGNRDASSNAPVTRTLYKLVGDPKDGRLQAVNVKLGITDSIVTEVLDGLQEKDVVVTGVSLPSAKAQAPQGNNPFSGGRRF
ncbi:efflux RND transporter periplasmic adaptor subunit [Opitutus sp. GAS368]|uniref:efflux RND transporter periplasmic adaptor subunit n=1 Tax=Opitutus sp. GAS368 TaxID=1882749 RepID=UPI00087D59E2|nr:efflux RND transporter periplasmic adaptor subunit [Opitutus sp. GAS368]SDS65672.1 HlyD family secretion protein [Opitutus sp. GAS368]